MNRTLALATLLIAASAHAQIGDAPVELADASRPRTDVATTASPFAEGLTALKEDRFSEAISQLTRELAANPRNGKAWYYRGVCHQQTGDLTGALGDLDRALELMPGDANALLRRAETNERAGFTDAARADLETILHHHSTGPIAEHALMELGHVSMGSAAYASALSSYDRLILLFPADACAWYNRAMARSAMGDHKGALSDLNGAIKLDKNVEKAYAARAIELINLERKAEACPDLQRAKELGDNSVDELLTLYCH